MKQSFDRELRQVNRELAVVNVQLGLSHLRILWYSGGSWLTSAAAVALIAAKLF